MNARAAVSYFFGIGTAAQHRSEKSGAAFTPTRSNGAAPITEANAVRIAGVYRALSIISTALGQLSLDVERGGVKLTDENIPAIIRRPNLAMTRREFIEALTISLAVAGNAYIHKIRHDGEIIELIPINPHECQPARDVKTGRIVYHYKGKTLTSNDIEHMALMRMPGSLVGLSPIEAARTELGAARDIRDYAGKWFTESGQPAGILSTSEKVSPETLKIMRNAWNYLDENGEPLPMEHNPTRVRALANGMTYTPIMIKPADAQWIEAQKFNTTQIARLFGIPAPLILAAVEGNAQTYSNVEQEWLAFTRFTLAGYMRAIEDALTNCTPRGQTVRFNVESLLRTDTRSRYEAHRMAIDMGLYSPEYARQIEGIPEQ